MERLALQCYYLLPNLIKASHVLSSFVERPLLWPV